MDPLVFGRRLRHFRKQAGLTLAQLGERVGRPAPFLSMVENGRRPLRKDQIPPLADALGVSVAELTAEEPPSRRAALEIELERMQSDPRLGASLTLPYVRPSPALSDEVLEHLVGIYRALARGGVTADTGRGRLRRANAATSQWVSSQEGYLSDLEKVAAEVLEQVGHDSDGPLSSRTLLDIAAGLGFEVEAIEDMVPGVRSVTDTLTGRIYIAQRNELRTRQARKAILQTLAGRLLGHPEPDDAESFLRQRVETAYLAAAILVPERSVTAHLHSARQERDIAVEDIKEIFYVSYEMAAWRFVNLATHHLGIRTHLLITDETGIIKKAYSNDRLPMNTDPFGGMEAQPACRRWGAVAVFASADKFDTHAQYTDTLAGTYFCVTHLEPDRPFAVTLGVPFDDAQWFRHRHINRRAASRCPEPDCCRMPTPEQLRRWEGHVSVSPRVQEALLGRLASDPYPATPDRRVFDLVERHSGRTLTPPRTTPARPGSPTPSP